MTVRVKLNSAGMLAALNQPGVRKAVTSAANSAASSIQGIQAHDGPVDVIVDEYQSDRPVAGITLAHAGGIGLQAEYGFLTEAAASAGLEVGGVK
ncbi:neck protein [Microbacterium phage phiMiGM15]